MSKPLLFNLAWYSRPLGDKDHPAPVTRESPSTLGVRKSIGAIILYPSLNTPAILGAPTDKLELLILAQDQTQLRNCLRQQLKISPGFDPEKKAAARDLFVSADNELIGSGQDWDFDCESIAFDPKIKVSTHSGRFSGFVDHRVHKLYTDAGYKHLYRIALSIKCLEAATGGDMVACFPQPQDAILETVLNRHHPELRQGEHFYAFGEKDGDVDFPTFDRSLPIQSWHPVFWYRDGLGYATFGHVSDIHMAARQKILAQSTARVIEYEEFGAEKETARSPHIGSRVNVTSRDFIDILSRFAGLDMIVVGGDLVDCLRSARPKETDPLHYSTPKKIWDIVDLGDNYRANYEDCVDLIAYYGIIVRLCAAQAQPAFLISGNHDCYLEPYGISPRIPVVGMANEGIPADHNLTFYEAILTFGNTYKALKTLPKSSFDSSTFDWFYTVLTPFPDYSVEFPKQVLVAAGWGDDENIVEFSDAFVGQGAGHLPRAPEGVSSKQLELIDSAIAKKKSMTLMTHFTFVSYDNFLPNHERNTELGDVYFDATRNYNHRNMGTFEVNRAEVLQDRVGARKMEIVLTGHSHRRALYLVDKVDYFGRNSLKIRHFDFTDFPPALDDPQKIRPAIIVSDSAGPIPRYNCDGEFSAWGSDQPSGTAVTFNSSGGVGGIHAVRTKFSPPRAVVALDYMDVYVGDRVLQKFETIEFDIANEDTLSELEFHIQLHEKLTSRGVYIRDAAMFLKRTDFPWRKINRKQGEISLDRGTGCFNIYISGRDDVADFINFCATHKDHGLFLALQFGADRANYNPPSPVWPFERYNFDDYWCFECQIDFSTSGRTVFSWSPKRKKFIVNRDKSRAESPDFDWRKSAVKQKYT